MTTLDQRTAPFVTTTISQMILDLTHFAINMRAPVAVIGKPGIGKTASLRRIEERDPHAVLVEFATRSRTVKGIHTAIMEAARWSFFHRSGAEIEEACEACAYEMAEGGRYLMIDEYQNYDLEAVRAVLRFHDNFRLPIVFVGNEKRLRKVSADAHTYDQIKDRLWKEVRLGDPKPEDFRAFAAAYGIHDETAQKAIVRVGMAASLRQVEQLLQAALNEEGGSVELTVPVLKRAEAFLLSGTGKVSNL